MFVKIMAGTSKGSLDMLSVYSSSDDEEYVGGPKVSSKRSLDGSLPEDSTKKQRIEEKRMLPSPDVLHQLFPRATESYVDSPEQHDGRIRSFPHERGNWSTLVYIHYESNAILQSFIDVAKVICSADIGLLLKPSDELHVSLTRTVVLRHHWINIFVESLKDIFGAIGRFQVTFGSVAVYTNEEKTRTFIGLAVQFGEESLELCVSQLDTFLAEFKLPGFYKHPSFHLSIAWCVGDHREEISTVLPQLNEVFKQFAYTHPEQWTSTVDQVFCKCGNKKYVFHLAR